MRPRPYTLRVRSGEIPERPYMEKNLARKPRPVVNGKIVSAWHKCVCGKRIPRVWKKCDDCVKYKNKRKCANRCKMCDTSISKYLKFCEPCRLKHVEELLDKKIKGI